jgi:hypothetical protein
MRKRGAGLRMRGIEISRQALDQRYRSCYQIVRSPTKPLGSTKTSVKHCNQALPRATYDSVLVIATVHLPPAAAAQSLDA